MYCTVYTSLVKVIYNIIDGAITKHYNSVLHIINNYGDSDMFFFHGGSQPKCRCAALPYNYKCMFFTELLADFLTGLLLFCY